MMCLGPEEEEERRRRWYLKDKRGREREREIVGEPTPSTGGGLARHGTEQHCFNAMYVAQCTTVLCRAMMGERERERERERENDEPFSECLTRNSPDQGQGLRATTWWHAVTPPSSRASRQMEDWRLRPRTQCTAPRNTTQHRRPPPWSPHTLPSGK